MDSPPSHVTSQAALADILGVHRNTIAAWLKQEGAPAHEPKGFNVKKWVEFAGQIAKRADVTKASTKAEWELVKIKETVRGIKLKNDELERELIRIDVAKSTITSLLAEDDATVRVMIETLPLQLQGLGIPEMREILIKAFDERREKMHKGGKKVTES